MTFEDEREDMIRMRTSREAKKSISEKSLERQLAAATQEIARLKQYGIEVAQSLADEVSIRDAALECYAHEQKRLHDTIREIRVVNERIETLAKQTEQWARQVRAALLAQVEVSTMFAKRLGLDDQAIVDCTAQATAALNIQQRASE